MSDMSDMSGVNDVSEVSDVNDVRDMSDVSDMSEVSDMSDVSDVSDVSDMSDVSDVSDVNDHLGIGHFMGEKANLSDDVVKVHIEKLLKFAEQRGMLQPLDVIVARNALLDLFRLDAALTAGARAQLDFGQIDDVDDAVNVLIDAAVARGLLESDTTVQRDLFDARLMGLLMPSASEVAAQFWRMVNEGDGLAATEYFYKLGVDGRYIRMDRIRLNEHWLAETRYGALEVTINLSKPEKDPRDIAAERQLAMEREQVRGNRSGYGDGDGSGDRDGGESYPQCVLCIENMGYAGRIDHPARQNHRLIPLQLLDETWYMQYSPYVYYNEHAIILNEDHVPMQITEQTFSKLLEFVEQFPHYFVGSNADLPIVGGSILNHDHFQAGRHEFAMERAAVDHQFRHVRYAGVEAQILAWPMSVVRLVSADKAKLLAAASAMLAGWREYSDVAVDIVAYSDGAGDGVGDVDVGASASERVPHNTITPIARVNEAGAFELDLVLRNNRTTAEHPLGLFHPHEPLHHIKKENIGLIEVMGLAILPGRLLEEIDSIVDILTGVQSLRTELREDEEHMLHKHIEWIDELVSEHGVALERVEAKRVMERAVGHKFVQVLEDAGVFRRTEAGEAAFLRFLEALGYEKIG